MIRCSDVHMSVEMSQQNVAPMVQRFAVEHYSPSAVFAAPEYAARAIVELVLRLGDATKVAHSVVRSVAVDVVDLFRLFTVEKKPCEPVREIRAPLVGDTKVSIAQFETAGAEPAALDSLDSADDSALGVIREVIADGIRNNFRIHGVSPRAVARGLVAPTTSSPIIPIASTIGKEFVSSGDRYRGPNGHPLSSKHRYPFFKERSYVWRS